MNKNGKTLTIFLVLISILLLSVTGISLFFFQKESNERKAAEVKLSQAKDSEAKLEAALKEAKKQILLAEEKAKEADTKINGLMDELELQDGIRDQMKAENNALKEAVTSESQANGALQKELTAAQERFAALEEKLKVAESQRAELEAKIQEMSQQAASQSEVDLDKIIVTPGSIPEGKIVSINSENNFVIVNLGQEHGMAQDMVLSVYRNDQYLGDLKIARAEENMSVADFAAPLDSKQLKVNDRIVVKK